MRFTFCIIGIGFKKHCNEFTVTRCRTEYDTTSEKECKTIYKKDCEDVYVTKIEWDYEEQCETVYEVTPKTNSHLSGGFPLINLLT